MKRSLFLFLCFAFLYQFSISQTTLQADGPGDTYELINSVMAPGYNVVEVPDCSHNSFPRHIDEVFDSALQKNVFRFFIHATPDNDRCQNFDRQRNEIKAYDKSPDNLLAVKGELIEYRWKFKLDAGFQPSSSFTHIHQTKAVGGTESSMPQITLTLRKGNPDKLELRYAETTSQTTLKQTDLTPFKGEWVEAKETILFGEASTGEYSIELTKVSDSTVLFSYENNDIRMWKTDADFIRPKWGIYRSLNDAASLRDEEVLFADFSIEELDGLSIEELSLEKDGVFISPNPFNDKLLFSENVLSKFNKIDVYGIDGRLIFSKNINSDSLDVSALKRGIYFMILSGRDEVVRSLKMIKE